MTTKERKNQKEKGTECQVERNKKKKKGGQNRSTGGRRGGKEPRKKSWLRIRRDESKIKALEENRENTKQTN